MLRHVDFIMALELIYEHRMSNAYKFKHGIYTNCGFSRRKIFAQTRNQLSVSAFTSIMM